jgi:hypothetical protein
MQVCVFACVHACIFLLFCFAGNVQIDLLLVVFPFPFYCAQ